MAAPTYTYTSNTPNASDAMNVTQSLILNNFRAINEIVAVNHVGFNVANDFGKHNLLNLQLQTTDPDVDATDVALYAKNVGSSNPSELVYRYPNNGTVAQLTPAAGSTSGGSAAATWGFADGQGWCQFSSGIIFKFGIATLVSNAQSGVSYPGFLFPTGADIPVFTTIMTFANVALTTSSTTFNYSNIQTVALGYGDSALYAVGATIGTQVYYFVIGI